MSAGIAFVPPAPIDDMDQLIRDVFQCEHLPVAKGKHRDFDCYVARFGDVCFIEHTDFGRDFLAVAHDEFARLDAVLGEPDSFLVYFHYDSSGDAGCAFVEDGRLIRRWAFYDGHRVIEEGPRTDVEMDMLAPAGRIPWPFTQPANMAIYEIMMALFGVCVFDTDQSPDEELFYRLARRLQKRGSTEQLC